jgi:ribonuclease HI
MNGVQGGAVIRDARGSFIAGAAQYYANVLDAPMGEVMALKEGMKLAQHMGCSRLIIHSDCTEVVDTMKTGGMPATVSAPVYDECMELWQEFVVISIEYCNRDTNRVADELARLAMDSKLSCIWDDEPPTVADPGVFPGIPRNTQQF